MKEDIAWNDENSLYPILDTQMDVRDGIIAHHHFSKKISSLEVMLQRSVMMIGSKV